MEMLQPSITKLSRWNRIVSGRETVEIGRTPKEVVYERDILTLYRFQRETPATQKHPILISYSLINRPAVLDLLPGRSVVERFLEAGFEVYLGSAHRSRLPLRLGHLCESLHESRNQSDTKACRNQ